MYYVYIYKNPLKNNEPFYVGRGKDDRFRKHLLPYMLKRQNKKNEILKEIIENNLEPVIEILHTGLTFTESNNIERELIKKIGRIIDGGTLTNITSGGQGLSGYTMTDEIKEKIKKTLSDTGHYEKLSKNMKGENNPMFGEKWYRTEDGKKSFNKKMKGVYTNSNKSDEELTQMYNVISNKLKGYKWSEEDKQKRSISMKKVWEKRNSKPKNKVIIVKDNEEMEFESINKAAKYLNISRWAIKNRFEKKIVINNIKIKNIE